MILLIDTSSSGIRLALSNGATKHIETQTQSLDLPGAAENFISENNMVWRDLTAVAVIVGPGSFTGIRLGIAYAKGLSIGRNIPVMPVSAFDAYLHANPDAFVAIDTGKGDFFCAAANLEPCVMSIDAVETKQFDYAKTVGHKPFDLSDAMAVATEKLNSGAPQIVIPMYIKPSYAEQNCKSS